MSNILQLAREKGIYFKDARMIYDPKDPSSVREYAMAMDAALVTNPNWGVPIELTYGINNEVIEILTAPRRAREIFTPRKFGDWTNSHWIFPYEEFAGKTAPYSDFSKTPNSYVNYTFPERRQYIFQTNIYYGYREEALLSAARINYAARLQASAANIIDIDANRFWFLGIAGQEIYGLLNDPNLPAAIASTGAWETLRADQIQDNVRALLRELVENSNGLITNTDELVLLVSPSLSVALGKSSEFNQTAYDIIKRYMPNVRVVVVPELANVDGGDTAYLIATSVAGRPTADLGYGELMQASPVIPHTTTAWEQSFWSSTYGVIIFYPFAIARMTGVTA